MASPSQLFERLWVRLLVLATLVLVVAGAGFVLAKLKAGLSSGTMISGPPMAAAGVPVKVEVTANPLDVSAGSSTTLTIKLLDVNNLPSEGGNRVVTLTWAPKDPFVQASGGTYTIPDGDSLTVALQVKPGLSSSDDVPITATWTDTGGVNHTSVVTVHVHP